MASKADFTEEEWETLHKGISGAGLWMAVSDRGFFDTFKEAGALTKHLTEARQNASSELIRELAGERGSGFGWRSSPEEIERETTGALQRAVQILQDKDPSEADAYKSFVLEVAESVGSAAAGGEAAETGTLDKIRAALGA
jgi:hypothetical protein